MVGKLAIFQNFLQHVIDRFIVEAQENFLYHLNLEIHRDHEKLILGIKGILCNQLLHLIEPDSQFYLDLIA